MLRLLLLASLLLSPVASAMSVDAVTPGTESGTCVLTTVGGIVACVRGAVDYTFDVVTCVLGVPPSGYPLGPLACVTFSD